MLNEEQNVEGGAPDIIAQANEPADLQVVLNCIDTVRPIMMVGKLELVAIGP